MADRLELRLPQRFSGVLAIADVHGQLALFDRLIEVARREGRFVVSLGDLVDRGPDNTGCIRRMAELLAAGDGLFIRGNHDDKLYRTLKGNPTRIDSELAFTIEQIDAAPDSVALRQTFARIYAEAPYLVVLGRTVLVHGGFAQAMLSAKSWPRRLRALAIYGEAKVPHPVIGKPVRTYGWLDKVPAGMTVVIGHHPVSDRQIMTRENAAGGRLVHLDAGAGKGRGLAALRLGRDGRIEDALRVAPDGATEEPAEMVPFDATTAALQEV